MGKIFYVFDSFVYDVIAFFNFITNTKKMKREN
jgi:hypothetical protein